MAGIQYITPDHEIFLIDNYFEKGLADHLYRDLKKSSKDNENGAKRHSKTIHFEALDNAWLRCPSLEENRMFSMSPTVLSIANEIKGGLNIAKIINYHTGSAHIDSHSDKILDLDPDYSIYLARFGATRTCILTNKTTGEEIKVPMGHGSLLVISYKANIMYRHAVRREPEVTTDSISIVLRKSLTKKCGNYVYGPHTPFATEDLLKEYLQNEEGDYWSKELYHVKLMECYKSDNDTVNGWTSIHDEILNNAIWE